MTAAPARSDLGPTPAALSRLPDSLFHPATTAWFEATLGQPTAPQLRAWPAIKERRPTLVAAPTGSGKTLAAFLAVIDDLVREGITNGGALEETTKVVYISPLKALSNDIEKNLEQPLQGILERLRASGEPKVKIRTAVRTGDTPAAARTAMLKHPPHILVTTPESLYILLTSAGGREMLRSVETVIVDEIHAMIDDKRGSHLSISLERLAHLCARPPLRIGLSATQRPIEAVADFLFTADRDRATIVDLGHRRTIDLALEMPASPLGAVMSNEVWEEIYDRIAELVLAHETTLVFVNTRRLSERVAKNLSDRIGKTAVTSHHGSLSRDQRHEAERRLKAGELRALVATASLELGIDIGSVDLVCQLGSTRSIATLLQRVGRSGHAVGATPKGRLFPLSRDELVEAIALVRAIARGELDHLEIPDCPLDILAQQIVAAVAAEDWSELELFDLVRRAWPFRDLTRESFDEVIGMLRDGFAGRTGRRGAYLHHDRVNGKLRARRGARLTAITNGGAIPDTADFDVLLEPGEIRVGTVNEDFAIESMAGNIFQLGNTSWRILKIEPGKVRVEDARGAPPTIPFWLGEAPARTEELSRAVSDLRAEVSQHLEAAGTRLEPVISWLAAMPGIGEPAARQTVEYLAASERALGVMPTQEALVLERFFDESGGMQLVLHSPYGSRLNRAWGLALRKRFCRKFNFELQAAATEDAIVLSLGVTHSFPLEEVFAYLNPETVRDVLVQALLDAPVWGVRWRWNATRALAVLRNRGGRRVPPQLQRMNADDLVSVVFPDQLACPENLAGDREVPDHPLVNQTLRDCLEEAMDLEHLEHLLRRMRAGELTLLGRDVAEPSPLAAETLNARPYAFLDDAPLEERRTQAVLSRRWLDPGTASDLAALDAGAIDAVRAEVWPQARSADELHEALVLAGFLTDDEVKTAVDPSTPGASSFLLELMDAGRVTRLRGDAHRVWVPAERLAQVRAVVPSWTEEPPLDLPAALRETWTADDALVELMRNRLEILGPVTVASLAESLRLDASAVSAALARLEGQGFALRGRFTPRLGVEEWCERGLLARIHRRTLNRLRAEIEPVTTEAYLRFLLAWQHVAEGERKAGPRGLEEVVAQLEGFEVAAGSWEVDILPDRVEDYERDWLDALGNAGKVVWQRRTLPATSAFTNGTRPASPGILMDRPEPAPAPGPQKAGPVRATPIALLRRAHLGWWRRLAGTEEAALARLSSKARDVLAYLSRRGPSFFDDIARDNAVLHTQLEGVLGELASLGLAYSDSFLGLRALLLPAEKRKPVSGPRRAGGPRRRTAAFGLEDAGRWVALAEVDRVIDDSVAEPKPGAAAFADDDLEEIARLLLRRWGVVFRRLLDREGSLPPWRDLLRVLRRLEAKGEIRGGRFINGFSGEQFALPEAIPTLRLHRRAPEREEWVSVSGADPLNLVGILTAGARVPAISTNRVLYRSGRPAAILLGRELRALEPLSDAELWEARKRLERRSPAAKAAVAV